MRRSLLACLLLFVLPCLPAAEPFTLDRLAAVSAGIATVRMPFTQTKHLAILDQPLVASGVVEINRTLGALRWEFTGKSTLIMRGSALRRFDAAGREETLGDDPNREALAGQMSGLLHGDWSRLQRLFDTAPAADGAPLLVFTPKGPDLARYLTRLELRFRDDLRGPQSLLLVAAGDDRTEYVFAEPEVGIDLPAARFAGP